MKLTGILNHCISTINPGLHLDVPNHLHYQAMHGVLTTKDSNPNAITVIARITRSGGFQYLLKCHDYTSSWRSKCFTFHFNRLVILTYVLLSWFSLRKTGGSVFWIGKQKFLSFLKENRLTKSFPKTEVNSFIIQNVTGIPFTWTIILSCSLNDNKPIAVLHFYIYAVTS